MLAVGLGLTITVIVFHVARAHFAGALWRDEISTVEVAEQGSIHGFFDALTRDSFPGFTAVLLHVWRTGGWGGTVPGLRVFGSLVGIGLVVVLWCNSWRLARGVPLLSLALLAMNPVLIEWGDSIRGYGIGALLALLTLGLMGELCRHAKPGRRLMCMTSLCAIAATQTLYQNCFFLAAICAGAAVVAVRGHRWWTLIVIVGIGAASALCLLIYLPVMRAMNEIHPLVLVPVTGPIVLERFSAAIAVAGKLSAWYWTVGLVIGLVGAICALAPVSEASAESTRASDLGLYALVVPLVGLPGFYLYYRILQFDLNVWYFIPIFALAAGSFDLAAAACLARFAGQNTLHRRLRLSLVILLLLCSVVATIGGFGTSWAQLHERFTNMDDVVRILAERVDDGDVILIVPEHLVPEFKRLWHKSNPVLAVPPENDPNCRGLFNVRRAMTQERPLEPTLDAIAEALREGHRVWAFEYVFFLPQGQLPPVLPPAPHPQTGWLAPPYTTSWEMQVGYYLQTHATDASTVAVNADGPVSDKEHIEQLIVLRGWHSPLGF